MLNHLSAAQWPSLRPLRTSATLRIPMRETLRWEKYTGTPLKVIRTTPGAYCAYTLRQTRCNNGQTYGRFPRPPKDKSCLCTPPLISQL